MRNILKELKIKSVRLMTNNPRKINVLTELGVKVTGRVPCMIQGGEHNKGYLEAKTKRMEHVSLRAQPRRKRSDAVSACPRALISVSPPNPTSSPTRPRTIAPPPIQMIDEGYYSADDSAAPASA